MKSVFTLFVFTFLLFTISFGQTNVKNNIKGYYCRLPLDDSGYTGKYADIMVDIPEKGRLIFSREYSYQPFWQPNGGKRSLVDRLIPRKGDGPDERPDKHNICSNASIVEKTDTSITVHWRYAPDLTNESFVDFRSAYNKVGNPSPFYAEFADENFTVTSGRVHRIVRKGCYKLDEWNNLPENWNLQYLNLKSETKQVQIGEIGSRVETLLNSDTYWRGWNHYPVQLIPSDGTRIYKYDRPASTCPSTFYELQHKDGDNIEAMVIYGLTNKKPEELTSLNRSWNFAPKIIALSGCKVLNYNKGEKAYYLEKEKEVMKFQIPATKETPIVNPAFIIRNFNANIDNVEIEINNNRTECKKGIEIDTDGRKNLVIWLPYVSEKMTTFKIFAD